MSNRAWLDLHNGFPAAVADLPMLSALEWTDAVVAAVEQGDRIAALYGQPAEGGEVRLTAVVARDMAGTLYATATRVADAYPSLTPRCQEAHLFEREIAEQWGVRPEGHPWFKPVRYHASYRQGKDAWRRAAGAPIEPAVTDFFRVEGTEVHEVAVGPVHAGVIEPGHFRFQCHGEQVFHLEIALGFQHRGVERALAGGPDGRTLHLAETLAGDTTIGHTIACASALEGLSQSHVSARAHALRGIMLELERLANHVGDLGALAQDIGFLPTAAFCGRLRGDFLNLSALICGNRFGRSMIRLGGVGFDLDSARAAQMAERLDAALRDVTNAVELLWSTPSVLARFEDTGAVSIEHCLQLGLVGPTARACGVERDVRRDFPTGIYSMSLIPLCSWHSGDVFARAYVRWMEIQQSVRFIKDLLGALPGGNLRTELAAAAPRHLVVSLTEGWRGEICHVVETDDAGRIARYKVVDPSFHNWSALAMALRDQQISDFPLCNKSFNLSYCGHDL